MKSSFKEISGVFLFLRRVTHHVFTPFIIVFLLCSCSSVPSGQPEVGYYLSMNQYDQAIRTFKSHPDLYGKRNRLLYYLDYGLTLHYAGKYKDSIDIFEKAKTEYDKQRPISVSRAAATWIINDTLASYRGEDFERVMINIFQALNFAALGRWQDALVEARDVDRRLKAINDAYPDGKKNVYQEDAFARLLMGLMYEASGSRADINDAWIEYRRAYDIYSGDYARNYHVDVPEILRQNYLAAAEFMGDDQLADLKRRWPGTYLTIAEKQQKAEVYLVQYHGTSPVKYQATLPLPIDGIITPVAFPMYQEQFYPPAGGELQAVSSSGTYQNPTELTENIGAIAIQTLENRRARTIAKSLIRSGIRTAVEHNQIENISSKHERAADWTGLAASAYNVISEQADLRSWQLLPGEIRLGRLILEPGTYDIAFGKKSLGRVTFKAGDKKFYIVRTIFQ